MHREVAKGLTFQPLAQPLTHRVQARGIPKALQETLAASLQQPAAQAPREDQRPRQHGHQQQQCKQALADGIGVGHKMAQARLRVLPIGHRHG